MVGPLSDDELVLVGADLDALIDGKDQEVKGKLMKLVLIGAGGFLGMLLLIIVLWYFFGRKR